MARSERDGHMSMGTHRKGIRSSRAEVVDSCKLPHVGSGTPNRGLLQEPCRLLTPESFLQPNMEYYPVLKKKEKLRVVWPWGMLS